MEVVLLLVIGVFLIYRMMQVEERMNKMERASKLKELSKRTTFIRVNKQSNEVYGKN